MRDVDARCMSQRLADSLPEERPGFVRRRVRRGRSGTELPRSAKRSSVICATTSSSVRSRTATAAATASILRHEWLGQHGLVVHSRSWFAAEDTGRRAALNADAAATWSPARHLGRSPLRPRASVAFASCVPCSPEPDPIGLPTELALGPSRRARARSCVANCRDPRRGCRKGDRSRRFASALARWSSAASRTPTVVGVALALDLSPPRGRDGARLAAKSDIRVEEASWPPRPSR